MSWTPTRWRRSPVYGWGPRKQEGGTSGPDGKIRLCNLPPGQYRLTAMPAAATLVRAPEFFNTVPITIVDRDVRDLTISALPLATVSGEVVWDSPPSDPAFQQVAVRIGLDPAGPGMRGADALIPSSFSFSWAQD